MNAMTIRADGEVHVEQTSVPLEMAHIGNAVGFADTEGVRWAGRVVDIRHNWERPGTRTVFVAVLGWPHMWRLTVPSSGTEAALTDHPGGTDK